MTTGEIALVVFIFGLVYGPSISQYVGARIGAIADRK